MIVDGRKIARDIESKLKKTFAAYDKEPHIDFLSFGEDPSTRSFLNIKRRVAKRIGVDLHIHELPENTIESVAEKILQSLVVGRSDGVVVQLPLPSYFNRETFLDIVPKEKDIDCLSPNALELYRKNENVFVPPVAAAVEEILSRNNIDLLDKKIAIVGYGNLVGKPVFSFAGEQRRSI
ncbi:MAG: tetrahydrofolate dehydrogenase/cyclohydrolase catalytic domain-containing protein [Candidatus Campbellbacteria bacterium]|nr:tetrahydrofolate dehydrogenase/cyclohydrolase catalytic domain-containing protein [Candidatus Campbellbacteria bacterium]